MANLPDPVGKIVNDLSKVRRDARAALQKMPLTDPLMPIVSQIDDILGSAETNVTKLTQDLKAQADRTLRLGR